MHPINDTIVLVHGLAVNRLVMWPLAIVCARLALVWHAWALCSLFQPIENHAGRLYDFLTHDLAAENRVHIVAHSMEPSLLAQPSIVVWCQTWVELYCWLRPMPAHRWPAGPQPSLVGIFPRPASYRLILVVMSINCPAVQRRKSASSPLAMICLYLSTVRT